MVPRLQAEQNVLECRRELPGAKQQGSRLVGEGVDDVGTIGERKPVMKRDALEFCTRICLSAFSNAATGTSNTRTTFRDPSPHRI